MCTAIKVTQNRKKVNLVFGDFLKHSRGLCQGRHVLASLGPTTGLERFDISIVPLVPHADALMITRGALRTCIPAESPGPLCCGRAGGQSILKELSNELVAVDVEDAVRLNASAMAVQVYIGGHHEHQYLNACQTVTESKGHEQGERKLRMQ